MVRLLTTPFWTMTLTFFFWSQLSPYSTPGASPPQELGCSYMVNEMAPPSLAVDTTASVSDSFGCGALSHVTHPSFSPLALALSSPTRATSERPSPSLNTLSHEFSPEGSEKTRDDDSTAPALSIPVCSSSDSSSAATQSIDPEVLDATPVVSAAMVDNSKPKPRQSILPDTTVVKDGASPLLGQSNLPQSQAPEHKNVSQHNSVLSSAVEDARELDTGAQDASDYQSHGLECDSDNETFEYKGVDSAPEALGTSPTSATEIRSTASSSPLLETRHNFSFGHAPKSPEKDSASASPSGPVSNTGKLSAVVSLSSPNFTLGQVAQRVATMDDSLIGRKIKYKSDDEIPLATRCASANDLSGMLEPVKAIHGKYFSN